MNKTLLAGQGSKRAPLKNRRHSLVEFCTYKLFTDVTIGALLGPGQDNEMCIRGPTIMKGYIWLWANHSTLLKATYWRPGYPWLPVSVFRSVNHQRVAYVTNFLYMHLKIVTLNWNRGIHNKLKSRGLIYSGFHLKVRISIKLQNSQCFWRGWGRGGGTEGKISFAQQSFIHKIAENQPQIVVFWSQKRIRYLRIRYYALYTLSRKHSSQFHEVRRCVLIGVKMTKTNI